jgi:basic membrane protein A
VRRPVPTAVAGVALAGVLAACGGGSGSGSGSTATSSPKHVKVGLVYDVGGVGDHGLDDGAHAGLAKAAAKLHVTAEELEPDPSGRDRADLLRSLAEDGTGLVIAVGTGYASAVEEVARQHLSTTFAVIGDATITGPNVVSVEFADEQGAYLVGAAGAATSTAHHLGFLAASTDRWALAAQAGFRAGAQRVLDAIRVDVSTLPANAAPGGAPDPEAAKAAALALFNGGADVVFAAPGSLTVAVETAAMQHGGGVHVIGYGADAWAVATDPAMRAVVLTSMLQQSDIAVYDLISDYVGSALRPGTRHYGVSDHGVGYSTSGGLLNPDVQRQLEDLVHQIDQQMIQVPTVP